MLSSRHVHRLYLHSFPASALLAIRLAPGAQVRYIPLTNVSPSADTDDPGCAHYCQHQEPRCADDVFLSQINT